MTKAITVSGFSPDQIAIIKRTVAKDSNDDEFNLFMEFCRSTGLNPFRKQVHAVVYNKNNPEKRNQCIIPSRDGLRVIAQRCGDYRPASSPPEFEYNKELVGPENPLGLVSATVMLHKQDSRGEWYPVMGQAFWDEFAPLKENWSDKDNTGRKSPDGTFSLDRSGKWATMGRNMLAKCAECAALRAGWPDQFGGMYAQEEMDKHEVEISATAALEAHAEEHRRKLTGGAGVMMVFDSTGVMEKVPFGKFADRCHEFIQSATPQEAFEFQSRNVAGIREFWAHNAADALKVKAFIEAKADQFNPAEIQHGEAAV